MVGLIPLFAVTTIEPDLLERLPDFRGHEWNGSWSTARTWPARLALARAGHGRASAAGAAARPPDEAGAQADAGRDGVSFAYGVRALSTAPPRQPVHARRGRHALRRSQYQPGESNSGLFGGNSNWRGPIWFPVNYLIIESLQKFHHYYGDDFQVECPTGSGQYLTLDRSRGAVAAAGKDLPARRRGRRAGVRGPRAIPARSALAGPDPVLRVFSWRHGGGRGREPSDRLDGAGGKAARYRRPPPVGTGFARGRLGPDLTVRVPRAVAVRGTEEGGVKRPRRR